MVHVEGHMFETIGLQREGHQDPVVMPVNVALAAPLLLDVCRKLLIATDGMYNQDDWMQIKDEVIAMQEAVKFATR